MDTKKLRQKVLDLAIRGKLVPQDPNDEPASVLLERIKAEKEQLIKAGKIKRSKKSASSDTFPYENVPFEIPESWVWTTLGDCCEVVTGTTPSKDVSDYYGGGIPFYKPTDLEQGTNTVTATDTLTVKGFEQCRKLPKNSILVTCIGATIGKTGIIRTGGACNQQINALIPIINDIHYTFLYYVCISNYFQTAILENSSSTTLPIINKGKFSELLLPLPPKKEQQRIIDAVESWFSIVDKIEREQIDLTGAIKQAKSKILDLAIHGKLVPQDPNDEPAIELLRRINPDFKPCDNAHYPFYIPNSWEFTTIGTVFQHNTGKALNKADIKNGKSLPYITTSNVYWGYFELSEIKEMYFKDSEIEKCTVKKGDLLICEGGDVGRAAIWEFDYNICIQNHIHRLRAKDKISHSFYLYVMMFYKWTGKIQGKGIGLQGMSSSMLDKLIIPVPPCAEQQRIVAKIEKLFATLDKIKESLEAAN